MPKRNAKSDHMQRKSLAWLAKVMEERTENLPVCCRSLAHPRKPSGSDGKVPFERWRGRGHHVGRCVFGEQVWYESGSVDRSNEGRRQERIWHIRRFPNEVQRVHFDSEWRSDNCSDNTEETCVRKVGQP